MAGKTPTELLEMIKNLGREVAVLATKAENDRERVNPADLAGVRERLAVVEQVAADLGRRVEEQERSAARLAVLETRQAEFRARSEEAERRRWQLTLLFFGSLTTLVVQIALVFVKR
jgi:monoamine oxidase